MGGGGPYTLGELADALGADLRGEAGRRVVAVAPLESAGPEDVSFVTDRKYVRQAATTRAGALVVGRDAPDDLPAALLRVASPSAALIRLLRLFHPEPPWRAGVDPHAVVAAGAHVDPSAAIGPLAVVEDAARIGPRVRVGALAFVGAGAEIGADTVLHPRAVVGEKVRIGARVIVHPGAVLGADGFGYAFDGTAHRKIPQVGTVDIADDVEIGANAAIDRATLGRTVIGRGTKIDNLVQVAHNCEIGEHVVIAAQSGLSGSCRVGHRVILAGQVGIADHVTIGEGAVLTAQAGVAGHVPAGEVHGGSPARPHAESRRIWAAERLLPELVRRVRELERKVRALEGGGDA
ncbi:MAG: UDP-3-O-(3-hydroxymyristoyl)glucosamine N-acyltransferase [Candidatus Rokubacteria bacterium]|nr:UDP-3-O-(3-hydroxymyristoyl)glucosamine N-acyltransferase [Candidatus Rokubacteria bacterium]